MERSCVACVVQPDSGKPFRPQLRCHTGFVCAANVQYHHTADIVPNAHLRLHEELGHFSIETVLIPAICELLTR